MAEPVAKPVSPISQVLQSIGLTRDDLVRHSDQMRFFLTQHELGAPFSVDPSETASTARGSSRTRSLSRPSAPAHPQTPPPSTPVKSEPIEPAMPLRQMDSMEMILERKSRQAKREKKAKAKDRPRPPPSPSPAHTSFSLDAFMQSRDSRRVPDSDQSDSSSSVALQVRLSVPQNNSVPPVTPQHRKYYRDYDSIEPPSRHKKTSFARPLSPTPTRSRTASTSARAQSASQDADPFTPRRNNYYKSPLPSSSPPRSSPFATPSMKRIVNLVSSPGPMGPLPDQDEYDKLPYKLPPGPYSKKRPELSYAALIGQAILSSPEHRLTLQEIYDWITIVYPYFQRNEATWMNSIRHVLSTTVCFRKVPRDRSLGRTQWAIWDCDLDCFANGNFRKEFCAEYRQAAAAKKPPPKKRPAEEAASGRKMKRPKKEPASSTETGSPAMPTLAPASLQGAMLLPIVPATHFLPIFPPCPSVHHQPYYEQCTQLPAEVIFPPLPPTSHYARVTSGVAVGSSLPPSSAVKNSDVSQTSPAPPSSSLPELIPNNGSSSSPQLLSEDHSQTDTADVYIESASPDVTLLEDARIGKGKKAESVVPHKTPPRKSRTLPPMPLSPTLDRRTRPKKKPASQQLPPPLPALVPEPTSIATTTTQPRPLTPPARPSTPPRNRGATSTVQLSPIRTPLSHKGLHMTPNTSLAHFKTHLDPPPHTTFNPDDGINPAVFDTENVRTPSRKRPYHRDRDRDAVSAHFPPVTPKKLVFPAPGSTAESPFRTPGPRIFDPHDPGTLLEEEFARLGAKAAQESPAGLYGRGLLYESPNALSPGKLTRWY
ncbi:hypothetical protein L210DRAFT_962107 [Boletus edulis BED1]|uniref:Fork-head domain-containing protein n=1 Tax=Boletus edulis BED1 TaxID=1328754 RepID=A0AAD4BK10_BOLED|nr:hypothetical protein L210DRAFT_962107 [Boletus edulis BED1]